MDGPFFIECLKEDNNITMKFIHNKKSSLEKFIIQTTFYELKNSVYRGTTQLIKLIKQKGIGNLRELDKLEQITDTLKDLVKK